MDECQTPTFHHPIEFKFNRSPAMIRDMKSIQDIQNLRVTNKRADVRCYTPNLKDFRSPGLSPIYDLKTCTNTPLIDFKKPRSVDSKGNRNYTPKHAAEADANGSNNSLNISKNNSILDHTLTIALLLKNVGLEQYSDAFENVNLNQFMRMNSSDLKRIGLSSAEHRKVILDLLKDLTTACYGEDPV